MEKLTKKQLIEKLKQYPDHWIIVVDTDGLKPGVWDIHDTYCFDEGEIGLMIN